MGATVSVCFNEAAGIPRGRLEVAVRGVVPRVRASMRPRVFPAEDSFVGLSEAMRRLVLQ